MFAKACISGIEQAQAVTAAVASVAVTEAGLGLLVGDAAQVARRR